MKLSDLLAQKLTIDSWNINPEISELSQKLSVIRDNIDVLENEELASTLALVDNDIHNVLKDLTSIVDSITKIKTQANGLVQEGSRVPLIESYDLYVQRKQLIKQHDLVAQRNTLVPVASYRELDQFIDNAEYEDKFNALIRKFASWKHSTVYVRPNSLRFFDALAATDVLYIMEQCNIDQWLKENLNEKLYSLARLKLINEDKRRFLTANAPAAQIGLIVMEHFMHFKPLDIIGMYLADAFELLKPGGHLMFTFNNCDTVAGVRNAESGLYCFTPGALLERMCEVAGFEVINFEASERISWLALKKPGELTSIKAGKTFGQIITE